MCINHWKRASQPVTDWESPRRQTYLAFHVFTIPKFPLKNHHRRSRPWNFKYAYGRGKSWRERSKPRRGAEKATCIKDSITKQTYSELPPGSDVHILWVRICLRVPEKSVVKTYLTAAKWQLSWRRGFSGLRLLARKNEVEIFQRMERWKSTKGKLLYTKANRKWYNSK